MIVGFGDMFTITLNDLMIANLSYFDDLSAGTTDFDFIAEQNCSDSAIQSALSCFIRAIFPV